MPCDFLPVLLDVPSGTPEASLSSGSRGTPRAKKRLKLAELSCGCSGLFPVSEGHKLIQNFLQSLEPPFVIGGAPPSLLCICVRFASLISAISSRSFLIRSDTNFSIQTVYSSEGRLIVGEHIHNASSRMSNLVLPCFRPGCWKFISIPRWTFRIVM